MLELLKNDNEVILKGLTSSGQIYFYQRWCEIVQPATSDPSLYRVMNTLAGIDEIIEVAGSAEVDDVSLYSLQAVVEECQSLLKEDLVLEKHAKPHSDQFAKQLEDALRRINDLLKNPRKDRKPLLLSLRYHVSSSRVLLRIIISFRGC